MRKNFKAALDNIATHGDTDVLPFPIENHIFFDKQEEALGLLDKIHADFDQALLTTPPIHETCLAVVGYDGFRSATQIDPLWNAYFLSLVLSIAEDIENARLPPGRGSVFSYRFKPDEESKSLWDRSSGWVQFKKTSMKLAQDHGHVLLCDISDFYPRIYHHRLENSLKKATPNTEAIRRIMELLSRLAKGVSYGLPVGGPASRLLSELLLNRVDRLLVASGIPFCRFADDYHIFAGTREEAYARLVFISEKLLENEGLSLQKAKTRILTSEEFASTTEVVDVSSDDEDEVAARSFLSLTLHYDPYSPTAVSDYEELRSELNRFDVVGMLGRELRKSRIHQALTRKLVRSISFLEPKVRRDAVLSLLDSMDVLYPVFPAVMVVMKRLVPDLESATRAKVFDTLRSLIRNRSYIVLVPANLAFALRVLGYDNSDETDEIIDRVYRESSSMMIKRDAILVMARRDADYWISDRRKYFQHLTPWERRALVVASYILEDEGKHWREAIRPELSAMDVLAMKWAGERKGKGNWEIPV